MDNLPIPFVEQTRLLMGEERFERYLQSFDEEPPVSIRLNPRKTKGWDVIGGKPVPWCSGGFYLPCRPNFTMDPLLHAGCYYVQEAASMFLDEVVRQQIVNSKLSNRKFLDLCAAPGGKSTLLRAALPEDCVLYSNEPVRQRASILEENVTKWGWPNHVVTNCFPDYYRKSKLRFDFILCDVPCSGEGMFRKDPATIGEWSPQHVDRCWRLQRDIVADAWACLNDGGLLVYSTCTFNTKENEENVRWMTDELGAEPVAVSTRPEWNITGSLLQGFDAPVYRFIPGITRSEGLFMCVLRKRLSLASTAPSSLGREGNDNLRKRLKHSTPLSVQRGDGGESVPLSYPQAISYLRGEALTLTADTPRGIVEVTFNGFTLGLAKNIGSRANNLYPKPWRIKTTHMPTDYAPILTRKS